MINEITITAKFVTGVTIQDSKEAKKQIERIFLERLEEISIFPAKEGKGIFNVEILKVKAEKI